jgi:hypothetical protein
MNNGRQIEVLVRRDGVELIRHRNGTRELRPTKQPFDSMAAAFEAIAAIA